MKKAGVAALFTSAACFPRLWMWADRPGGLWVLWLILLWAMFFLWEFVFAWQETHAKRPVITWEISGVVWIGVTVSALVIAWILAAAIDPGLRTTNPEDYPESLPEWVAMMLFIVFFESLFLCFAPVSFFVRLSGNRRMSLALTVLFGVFVLFLKMASTTGELSPVMALKLFVFRVVGTYAAVWLFLRGGVVLVWYWIFLIQLRHLWHLAGG